MFQVSFAQIGVKTGFTLAELLIALAILGVIATFTIPKILSAEKNGVSNAAAHEAISMVSGAYQLYAKNAQLTGSTTAGVLTPYMNYVSIASSGSLDDMVGLNVNYTCGSGIICLRLHNGGTLFYKDTINFAGTSNTNFIYFLFDPDSIRGTSGNSDGPSKSLSIVLYYNGRITSWGNITSGSISSDGTYNPGSYDPSWFQW